MKATVDNMSKIYTDNSDCVMYSHDTGEEYSANPADYWLKGDEVFQDYNGKGMVLVRKQTVFTDL